MRLSRLYAAAFVAALMIATFIAASWNSQDADAALDAQEASFLTLINNYRAQNGAGPLVEDAGMQEAAEWLANDMATKDYMSHTDSLGRSMTQRLQAIIHPFPYQSWGENIAAGYSTAEAVMGGWKGSPPHNANMLNPNYNVIGIALVCKSGNTYNCYWATDFGKHPNPGPTPPATATKTPTFTPSPSPTPSPTPTPTPVNTNTPSPTPSPTPIPGAAAPVPSNGESILLTNLTVGGHQLTLASAENLGLVPGDVIMINPGGPNQEVHTIQGLDPLRTAGGFSFNHAAGEKVVKIFSGDVDCDGDVDQADTMTSLKIVGGLDTTGLCIAVANVNCDGAVNGDDVILTLRRAALEDVRSPKPGCPGVGGPTTGNTNLTQPTGAAARVAGEQPGGGNVIFVADTTRFAVGDTVRINPGGSNEEENTVTVVGVNYLELATDLQFEHGAGEHVIKVIWTPQNRLPVPTPTEGPTGTPTPVSSTTPTPTATPTLPACDPDPEEPTTTPCVTPTPSPTPTPTATPSPTPTPSPTFTPSPTPTPCPTECDA